MHTQKAFQLPQAYSLADFSLCGDKIPSNQAKTPTKKAKTAVFDPLYLYESRINIS